MAKLCREHDTLIFVDCVASLGGMPFKFDTWDIDVAVSASQKALMAPIGLSFAVLQRTRLEGGRSQ